MARPTSIIMATDIRGQVTYSISPPTQGFIWEGILTASAAQSVTLPLTPDVNVPWQVFMKFNNPTVGSTDVWVSYTPPGGTPVAAALPTGTLGVGTSVLEPAGWTIPGGSTLQFISSLSGDQISLVAYLGVRGNITNG